MVSCFRIQGLHSVIYFELQCLFYYGFYIRRDSLIQSMIGGKIIFGLITTVLELLECTQLILTTPIFMLTSITNTKWDIISTMLNISEEAFITITYMTTPREEVITISIFIKLTRKSTSVGEVGIPVSCSKLVTILGTTSGERKEKLMKDCIKWLGMKRSKINLTSTNIGL